MMNRKRFQRLISAVMILSLAAGMLTGCGKNKRVAKETEATTLGIDVARYQGTIDWQEVASSGVEFAMIRVGYRSMLDGVIKEDSNGRYNLQEAVKAGIPLGVYFFSTALSEEEAVEEAQWVAALVEGYPITYPVVYDCENYNDPDSRQYGMTLRERTNAALAFLEEIEKLGYEGMFYASKNDMEESERWDMGRIENEYKVWVAQYPSEPYPYTQESSYSGVHQMWQYSMEGQIPGIKVPVDLNVAYFGYDGTEPAKSNTVPEEVEPDVEAMMDFDEVSEDVTAKDETNLRSIPSQDTDSEILRKLKSGEVAQRIAVSSSGWSKLLLDGEVYYAVSSYLTTNLNGYDSSINIGAEADSGQIQTQFQPASYTVTAKDTVNLRSLPSVEHPDVKVIAQLKNGDTASCVGTSDNGWSKLNYRGTTCYAISSYLKQVEGSAAVAISGEEDVDMVFAEVKETVTAKEKVNLRTRPNTEAGKSEIVMQLYEGDVATRVGVSSNGWSKLIYNDMVYYAVSRYLVAAKVMEPQTPEIETVFEEVNDQVTAKVEVNLRTLPSTEDPACKVVAKLRNGEVIRRTGINEDMGWSRVIYDGQILYCVSSYLKTVE